ncbi:MAG: hypothetical protein ABSA96_10620 [Candidatus Acidiferrales bacterium]
MSSGTQTDLDWAGIDAGNGASGEALPGGINGADAATKHSEFASMTDEEILGIDPPSPYGGFDALAPMPEWLQALVGDPKHGAEAQQLWQEHQAFRAAFSSADEARMVSGEARALRELLPGGAQEVQALRQIAQEVDSLRAVAQEAESLRQNAAAVREATQSVERIDAAIFSGDARAQSEVVAEIARANPAAFRSMFAEAAKVLAGLGAVGREAGGTQHGNGAANVAGRGEAGGISEGRPTLRFGSGQALGSGSGQALRKDGEGWGTRNSDQQQSQNLNPNQNQNPDSNQNSSSNQNRYASEPNQFDAGREAQGSVNARARSGPDTNLESPFARAQGEQITLRSQSGQANQPSQSLRTSHSPFAEAQGKPHFDPAAYASFERATNDVVARDVRGSIGDTLARVLPDGVADGAAKRIGDDIFNEVHRALAADRTLSEQVGEVLRDRRFGNAEQQRVAALLAGRAKQLVPSVARRVIGEWTSSVLGTARTKAARQAAAASRVDIAAPGGSLDSTPLRAMSAREVDYASMSDDEILGM